MNVYLLFNFSENLTNNVSSGSHVLMKLICLYQGNTTGPDKTDSPQTHYSGKECEWNKCNAGKLHIIWRKNVAKLKCYFIQGKEKVFSLSV